MVRTAWGRVGPHVSVLVVALFVHTGASRVPSLAAAEAGVRLIEPELSV